MFSLSVDESVVCGASVDMYFSSIAISRGTRRPTYAIDASSEHVPSSRGNPGDSNDLVSRLSLRVTRPGWLGRVAGNVRGVPGKGCGR